MCLIHLSRTVCEKQIPFALPSAHSSPHHSPPAGRVPSLPVHGPWDPPLPRITWGKSNKYVDSFVNSDADIHSLGKEERGRLDTGSSVL